MEIGKKYTPSGARRAGDDYQDIVALDVLVSMLEHPDRYEWVRVEADGFGYLDDVVALKRGGVVEAIQVKYSVNPEDSKDPYDWDNLTATRKGKNGAELPSLIGKWGPTILELLDRHAKVEARLVTNRRAGQGLSQCIDQTTDRVRLELIPPDVMQELSRQFGGDDNVVRFFSVFEFRLDRPDLEAWEAGIYRRFSALGGSYEGWLNLKDEFRSLVREKNKMSPDGCIRLADVQRAALWHRLEALPQQFAIPVDYVLPSKEMHGTVLGRLADNKGTCLVISGTPGIGKSTYLSVLHEELREREQTVVRHHYFLSLSDTTVGRFEHMKVIGSIMADLQTAASDALGTLDSRNPVPSEFPKWLDACSTYYSTQQFPLVIIIDGLDHVWRENLNASELVKLFEHLLPCRLGICLVVGTQPLTDANLPKRLLDAAPRESWITLPPLDRQAVLDWTRKNESRLDFRQNAQAGDHEEEIREIAVAFFDVSEGQPLLLRYGLSALIEVNQPVNATSIRERCRSVGGSITNYYRSLWSGLGPENRFLLCMIVSAGFEWPVGGLAACCARKGIGVMEAERSWQQVVHMMCRIRLGWRPFHGSLGVFVAGTEEYAKILEQVQPAVAAWLTEDAPDYWRWAYAWPARSDMGEHEPLLSGTTREWVVESIAKGYPHAQVCNILGRAARRALLVGDFKAFAHKALLFEYANAEYNLTTWNSRAEWMHSQLACNFVERLPYVLFNRRTELDDHQLAVLAESLRARGNSSDVSTIVDDLIDRFNTRTTGIHDWLSGVTPIVLAESCLESVDASRIADRIKRNRQHCDSVRFSRIHAEALRMHRRAEVLRQLCDADLSKEERGQFLKQGFLLALEEGADWSDVVRRHNGDIISAIYARITGLGELKCPDITFPAVEFLNTRSLYGQQTSVKTWLIDCFDRLLALFLWGKESIAQEWLYEMGQHTWRRLFLQHLATAAKDLAAAILTKRRYSPTHLYNSFAGLDRPDFNDGNDSYEFWQITRQVLTYLSIDYEILANSGATLCFERESIESALISPHCYWVDWLREYVNRRRPRLNTSALDWIVEKYGDDSGTDIEDISRDGVSQATVLASLMAIHGRRERAFEFLLRAVDLTVTYGNHKDLLLNDYVEGVELLAGQFPETARQEMRAAIPAILHVREFTDGDETSHVPGKLFELLATLSPEWLPQIYHNLCHREDYHQAEDAMRGIVKSLLFTSLVEIALGGTCLDKECFEVLVAKAKQGCVGAQQAIDSIQQLLGRNSFPVRDKEEKGNTSNSLPREHSAVPNAADYPPSMIHAYWKAVRESSYGRGKDELRVWADHWGNQESLSSVRDALVSLSNVEEFAEVASIIHDIIVRLEGRAQAWPWLVKAHRQVHGWSAHWTRVEEAREKWEIVKRYYPDQWCDFVKETMAPGRLAWENIGIHGRFQRLLEYLLLLGKDAEAKSVLQGVREVLEALVTPFGVGPADWIDGGNMREDRLLGVLLARLTWPSGMVRERACNSLADLLVSDETAGRVSSALMEWIGKQSLESVACIGLLPFVRARQLNAKASIPTTEVLCGSCTHPSLLLEILLAELYSKPHRTLPAGVGHSGDAPSDFQPSEKFTKHCDRGLPTMYRDKAASIERQFGVPFRRQWAYEAEHTGDGLRNAHGSQPFWGRSDGEHYVGFDCPLSEGLRSGYLRALAWLAEQGQEQRNRATLEALQTLPIDLGLWQISTQKCPEWWPVRESPDKSEVDSVPTEVFRFLEDFWIQQQGASWMLAMASGRIAEGGANYDLEVFGIFQKCLGSETPDAEDVWESRPWRKQSIILQTVKPRFCGPIFSQQDDCRMVRLGDWMILPCVLAGHPYVISRWQWWRMLRGIWVSLPALVRDGRYGVDCQHDRIAFKDEDGEFGFWQDWTAGVSEMQDADLSPRNGQLLMLKRSVIERFAVTNGLTFCWVCRITGFQREYGTGEYGEFGVSKVIGASRIVL